MLTKIILVFLFLTFVNSDLILPKTLFTDKHLNFPFKTYYTENLTPTRENLKYWSQDSQYFFITTNNTSLINNWFEKSGHKVNPKPGPYCVVCGIYTEIKNSGTNSYMKIRLHENINIQYDLENQDGTYWQSFGNAISSRSNFARCDEEELLITRNIQIKINPDNIQDFNKIRIVFKWLERIDIRTRIISKSRTVIFNNNNICNSHFEHYDVYNKIGKYMFRSCRRNHSKGCKSYTTYKFENNTIFLNNISLNSISRLFSVDLNRFECRRGTSILLYTVSTTNLYNIPSELKEYIEWITPIQYLPDCKDVKGNINITGFGPNFI